MRLPVPDLAPLKLAQTRRLLLFTLALTLLIALILVLRDARGLPAALGDTDDATRLVAMRELAHGRGWWDQLQTRFQPPTGAWSHWSRLIDGGLAALNRGFALFTSEREAELLTRIVWPLLWIFPALAAVLLATRRLAGQGERGLALRGLAVLAGGVLVLTGFGPLTLQFHPGRVDHHDVQITLSLIVLAGAMASGIRGAAVAGAATGLGLAIGLEALMFESVLAASLGLRVLLDRTQWRRAAAFGLALAGVTAVAFFIQTPPARWGVPACDALGSNLLAGTVLAGLGLAAAAWATRDRDWRWRLGALAVAGGVALGVYLALDPRCTRGIFADVDPAIRPFWLDHVNEVKTWPQQWRSDPPDAVAMAVAALMGLGAWAALGLVPARRRDAAWWTLGGALVLGVVAAWTAVRMRSYLEWFAVIPLAVAAAEAARRSPRLPTLAAVVAGALLAPTFLIGIILMAGGDFSVRLPPLLPPLLLALAAASVVLVALRVRRQGWREAAAFTAMVLPLAALVALTANADRLARAKPKRPKDPPDFCYSAGAFRTLATLPRGVTVSEVDLGPFVLAHTPSSAMSGPYHRMSPGILASRAVLVASGADAEAKARAISPGGALGPVYILECRRHRGHFDRDRLRPEALQAQLDAERPPAWLERLSPPGAPVEIYRPIAR